MGIAIEFIEFMPWSHWILWDWKNTMEVNGYRQQFTVAIEFYGMEKILWKSMATVNSLQ